MAASLSRQNDGLTCMVHPDALAAAVWHMGGMVDVEHTADLTTLLGRWPADPAATRWCL